MKVPNHPFKSIRFKKRKRPVWTFLFFLFFVMQTSIGLHAQNQVSFRQLSVKDGLSQNSAIAITQDSTGNMWIATQDGLNRYDGRKFVKYPFHFIDITRPNYSHLGKIYLDREQQLWIIPMDNIPYKYNRKNDVFEPMFNINDVYTVFQDKNMNYWFSTYGKEVFFVDAQSAQVSKIAFDHPLQDIINTIAEVQNDTLLLLGRNEFVKIDINTKNNAIIKPKDAFGNPILSNFSTLTISKSGKQYLGTYGNGLFIRNKENNLLERIPVNALGESLPKNLNILNLLIDSKNRLWISTYGQGLYMLHLKTQKIAHFTNKKHNPRTLHYNDILCAYEDSMETLWFGTDGAGLSYYDQYLEKFNAITNGQIPENINVDVVRSIEVAPDSILWIGTSGKGLTRYDQKKNLWKTFSQKNSGLPSNRIMSLFLDEDKDLWIGTQGGGLSILRANGSFKNYSPDSNITLSAKTIWDIYKDDLGQFWLATNGNGLIQFEKSKGEIKKFNPIFSKEKSSFGHTVRVITPDPNGTLWLGTDTHGVINFNPANNTFTAPKTPQKEILSENSIKSLHYAANGTLWIGTNGGGLNAFDLEKEKIYTYTTKDGLANDVIYAILPDESGDFWLSSNRGISNFKVPDVMDSKPIIINYTNYAGLATEFNTGAYYKDKDGILYFGGLDGFYWFDPDAIAQNKLLPKTIITGFEVGDETYPISADMHLEHDQNTLSFTFSNVQYSLPEKNRFQYRLGNYDNDWVQAGNTSFARYSQLPPGKYEFQVKSSNYDGIWNHVPERLHFTIARPWYLTNMAKFTYAFLFLGILLGIYRYLKWRWGMQLNLQLKEEEAERLQKLNDFKSGLYTDIAHEFKTPLTLISGPID